MILRRSLAMLGRVTVLSAILLLLSTPTLASSGDREPGYQHCVSTCKAKACLPLAPPLSPILRATFWTCESDCAYRCTHAFTSAQPDGERTLQFHGKWPFWRVLGMQEPASVLFSVGNALVHYSALKKIRRRVADTNPLKPWAYALAVVQLNTWIWSAVFHTRDLRLTERMDYFSATATIMYTLHYTLNRLWHLYPTPPSVAVVSRRQIALSVGFALVYISHLSYLLSTPRFDYGYNIAFNVCLGAIHLVHWTLFSLAFTSKLSGVLALFPTPYPPHDPRAIHPKPNYHWSSGALVLATSASMSLELFDFPALGRVIDAHSLWHLATIFLASGWYTFIIRDVNLLWSVRTAETGASGAPRDKGRSDMKAV